MMSRFFLFSCLLFNCILSFAQSDDINWIKVDDLVVRSEEFPIKHIVYKTDFNHLTNVLDQVRKGQNHLITLPSMNPDKEGLIQYRIKYSSVMQPKLEAKHLEFSTFRVESLDGSVLGRIGISPYGVYGSFFKDGEELIMRQPKNGENGQVVIYYLLDNLDRADAITALSCGTVSALHNIAPSQEHNENSRGFAERRMRNYRIAISTTAGFAQEFNYDINKVLAKIVEAINNLNTKYNIDLGFHFTLIDRNDELLNIFPNLDYFVNDAQGLELLDENQNFINSKLSPEEYDVSQVFTFACTDVGGVVSGRACEDWGKARGVSCYATDDYFMTTFKHELGHQFNGGHTFNSCNGSSQYNPGSSYEPGAGSTILSYGNNCGTDNVGSRKDYFHIINIIEMTEYAINKQDKCGVLDDELNHDPEVYSVYPSNKLYIPIKTPFELEGNGVDLEDANLTYNWEQFDLGTGNPLGTNFEKGPLFVSVSPAGSGKVRTIPTIFNLMSNASDLGERLPEVSRSINFKLTARDNHAEVGGLASTHFTFNSSAQAGPFVINFPNQNSDTTVVLGDMIEIVWDVANTDKEPVNTKMVNILGSANNGLTFIDTLVKNTPNDGRELIMLSRTNSKTRFKVKAVDNMFFNISTGPITVVKPTEAGFSWDGLEHSAILCGQSTHTFHTRSIGWNGFSDTLRWFLANASDPNLQIDFENDYFFSGTLSQFTVKISGINQSGLYDFNVGVTDGKDTIIRSFQLNVLDLDININEAISPINGDHDVAVNPELKWVPAADALNYEIQISTNSQFNAGDYFTYFSATPNIILNETLKGATAYFWRVRAFSECGNSAWSDVFTFRTDLEKCIQLSANELPVYLQPDNEGKADYTVKFNNLDDQLVSNVKLSNLGLRTHELDIVNVDLISPNQDTVTIYQGECDSEARFLAHYTDDAEDYIDCDSLTNAKSFKPVEPFSKFNNTNTLGDWSLHVYTNVPFVYLVIDNADVDVCYLGIDLGIVKINLDTVKVKTRDQKIVRVDELSFQSLNTPDDAVVYTLLNLPAYGDLYINGEKLAKGDKFTQYDVNELKLLYKAADVDFEGLDSVTLISTDKKNGYYAPINLVFDINNNNSVVKHRKNQDFITVYPNPSSDRVNIPIGKFKVNSIEVISPTGNLFNLSRIHSTDQLITLNTSDLSSGFYIIRMHTNVGSYLANFVKL